MYRYNRVPDGPSSATVLDALFSLTGEVRPDIELERIFEADMGLGRLENFSSGRQALARVLRSVEGAGEVLVPAYGCPIVAAVVRAVGMEPVFVDIEPRRFCVSAAALESSLTAATSAVVLVHEFGNPVPQTTLEKLRSRFSGPIIEDCAVALGARYKDGTRPGAHGDAAVFSGSLGKPVGAAAWGGLAVRGGGWGLNTKVCGSRGSISSLVKLAALKAVRFRGVYDVARPLLGAAVAHDRVDADVDFRRPSTLDARIMYRELVHLDEEAGRRWNVGRRILDRFSEAGLAPMLTEPAKPMIGRIPFYIPRRLTRQTVIDAFAAVGIELDAPFQLNFSGATQYRFPAAADALDRVLCLTYRRGMAEPIFWSRLDAAIAAVKRLQSTAVRSHVEE